jgi:hypothetical protein
VETMCHGSPHFAVPAELTGTSDSVLQCRSSPHREFPAVGVIALLVQSISSFLRYLQPPSGERLDILAVAVPNRGFTTCYNFCNNFIKEYSVPQCTICLEDAPLVAEVTHGPDLAGRGPPDVISPLQIQLFNHRSLHSSSSMRIISAQLIRADLPRSQL